MTESVWRIKVNARVSDFKTIYISFRWNVNTRLVKSERFPEIRNTTDRSNESLIVRGGSHLRSSNAIHNSNSNKTYLPVYKSYDQLFHHLPNISNHDAPSASTLARSSMKQDMSETPYA